MLSTNLVKTLKSQKFLFILGLLAVFILSLFVLRVLDDRPRTDDEKPVMVDERSFARLGLKVSLLDFGPQYRTPQSNVWHYLHKDFVIRQDYEIKGNKVLVLKTFGGRSIEFSGDFRAKLSSVSQSKMSITVFGGSCHIKPWSRTLQSIQADVNKESFQIKSSEDYLDITLKNNVITSYNYKTNGVLLTKQL